jgi:hypothetical protein
MLGFCTLVTNKVGLIIFIFGGLGTSYVLGFQYTRVVFLEAHFYFLPNKYNNFKTLKIKTCNRLVVTK